MINESKQTSANNSEQQSLASISTLGKTEQNTASKYYMKNVEPESIFKLRRSMDPVQPNPVG